MQSVSKLTVFLCCAWAISLLYGEMVAFWVPLRACSWPPTTNGVPNQSDLAKIAVLADLQLTDRTSNGLAPTSLALEALQFYTDIYMRRCFQMSILPFKPDLILFLGDQFDGGPFLSDEEWQESLSRFKHITNLNQQGRNSDIPVHYLSGNHDIGYAGFHSLYSRVISRYENEFGARNFRFTVGKVDFIVVDAQTLDGNSQGNLTYASWNFVKNISMDVMLNPRVLLTHIPLYRPNDTPCGPYRSSPVINQRVSRAGPAQEIKYQNYLSEETSARLLDMIKPILILSGHDHDQCTVTHRTRSGSVTEHTVGTMSWQQGNFYPSFMLLSATALASSIPTNPEDAVSTSLCFLPKQTHIYIWYLSLFVVTLLLLLFWPTKGLGFSPHYNCVTEFIQRAIRSNFQSGSKEKDDDENCDYEMIWDAEGSMHLVKKALHKSPATSSSDLPVAGRGNAVVRPTAKKHIAQETQESFAVVMNTKIELDDAIKAPRSNKSKTKTVIQRLIRTSRLLMIIAAVNVPLYMMLLFKDWIDQ